MTLIGLSNLVHVCLRMIIYCVLFLKVASRVQKYFIKLAKAGLPVPGRMPNLPRPGNRVSVQKWVLMERVWGYTEVELVGQDGEIVFCDYTMNHM